MGAIKKFGYFLIAVSVAVALIIFFNPGLLTDYPSYEPMTRTPREMYDVITRVAMALFALFSVSRFGYFLVKHEKKTDGK